MSWIKKEAKEVGVEEVVKASAELLKAIKDNLEPCKEFGIDSTGSFVREQYIGEEIEHLENAIQWLAEEGK